MAYIFSNSSVCLSICVKYIGVRETSISISTVRSASAFARPSFRALPAAFSPTPPRSALTRCRGSCGRCYACCYRCGLRVMKSCFCPKRKDAVHFTVKSMWSLMVILLFAQILKKIRNIEEIKLG